MRQHFAEEKSGPSVGPLPPGPGHPFHSLPIGAERAHENHNYDQRGTQLSDVFSKWNTPLVEAREGEGGKTDDANRKIDREGGVPRTQCPLKFQPDSAQSGGCTSQCRIAPDGGEGVGDFSVSIETRATKLGTAQGNKDQQE